MIRSPFYACGLKFKILKVLKVSSAVDPDVRWSYFWSPRRMILKSSFWSCCWSLKKIQNLRPFSEYSSAAKTFNLKLWLKILWALFYFNQTNSTQCFLRIQFHTDSLVINSLHWRFFNRNLENSSFEFVGWKCSYPSNKMACIAVLFKGVSPQEIRQFAKLKNIFILKLEMNDRLVWITLATQTMQRDLGAEFFLTIWCSETL